MPVRPHTRRPSSAHVRGDLARLARRRGDVREFSLGAARVLARAVPFDGVCVLTLDPTTLVPTGEVVEDGLPPEATRRMAEIEVRGEDVNAFGALAGSARRAASLSEATGGDLDRSLRHEELRRPNGFGDELRVALVADAATWGGLTLLRRSDSPAFAAADVELVASLAPVLAEGLRRAVLGDPLYPAEVGVDEPGFVLVDADNAVARMSAAAETLLAELGDDLRLPPVVTAVATHAREVGVDARARVRLASGRWLVVRGAALGDGQVAVIVESARAHELAPLVADAYGLTERERIVTEHVARGHATEAIAERLHLSPWTVQDHLKSIFEKVGVRSRGELVARVFFEREAPRLHDRLP